MKYSSSLKMLLMLGAFLIALPAAAGTLSPRLKALAASYHKAPQATVARMAKATTLRAAKLFAPHLNAAGQVQIYLHYQTGRMPSRMKIAELGASGILVSRPLGVVQAWVPITNLHKFAELGGVNRVGLPVYGMAQGANLRPATSSCKAVPGGLKIDQEGIAAENVAPVHKAGGKGAGVKVGIISVGADCLTSSQNEGYLPSNIYIPPGMTGSGSEGVAMLEEVHAMAPDTTLGFCDGLTTADFLTCYDKLAQWGAEVISDDMYFWPVSYNYSNFTDQDTGKNAIVEFANAHPNVSLTTIAGNSSDSYFEANYKADTSPSSPDIGKITLSPSYTPFSVFSGCGGSGGSCAGVNRTYESAMIFGAASSKSSDAAVTVTVYSGGSLHADLTWNDPIDGPYDDLDLFLLKADGTVACATDPENGQWCASTSDQATYGSEGLPPFEWVNYTNNSGSTQTFYLVAYCYDCNAHGTNALHVKLYGFGNGSAIFNYTTPGGVAGHSALDVEITTAAACYDQSGAGTMPECSNRSDTNSTIEYYSDTGPFAYGDWTRPTKTRRKPDITGIDGVTISGAGGFDGGGAFFGTSAASPNVGAVIALMRGVAPNAEPSAKDWKQLLMDTANPGALTNYKSAGGRNAGGAGLVDAAAALSKIAPSALKATITVPANSPFKVKPGTDVDFAATCKYQDNRTPSYKWSFGKSGSGAPPDATGLQPAPVQYSDGGVYTVTFTCSVGKKSASDNTLIAVQAAATAKDASFKTGHNQKLNGQLAGSGLGGEAVSFVLVKGPAHGKVNVADDGKFSYTPEQGFAGDDSFQFAIKNGVKESNTATVTIDVAAGKPPVAKDGTLTTKENQEATGTLSATDPDGDSLTFRIVTQPQHGKVSLGNPNTGAYTYTPAHNYSGADSFVFVANDGTADSNKATVKVTVKKNSGGGGGGAFGGLGLGLLAGLGGLIFLIRRKR